MLIRTVVGHNEPLDPGLQHTQNFTRLLRDFTKNIWIEQFSDMFDVTKFYDGYNFKEPAITVEYKSQY